MQSLCKRISIGRLQHDLLRCGVSGYSDATRSSGADNIASTSGRDHDALNLLHHITTRSYSAASPSAGATALRPSPNTSSAAAAPGGPAANPSSSSSSGSSSSVPGPATAPFYAGLAQRFPDPDSIPENLLHRLRAQLFGQPVQLREKTGRRALARPLQGKQLADWYFLPPQEAPGFHNEEREYEVSKALNRRHKKDKDEEPADTGKAATGGKKKK